MDVSGDTGVYSLFKRFLSDLRGDTNHLRS